MLRIETLACEAMAIEGSIPETCAAALKRLQAKDLDAQRIRDLERRTRHETVAFLTHIEELIGPEAARYLHFGLTSSDVLDTCLNLQLQGAADILIEGLGELAAVLRRRAIEHKYTICMGRSHGIHAEPTTFGIKLAFAYAEIRRAVKRMQFARREISTGAISGPVGTYSGISPAVESYVCGKLGLRVEPVSSQVIPRDRHAAYFTTMAVTASSLERIATEIRSLQRTEIQEIEEAFAGGQKGSSAMPHKRNPILSENVTGLARLVRSQVTAALENVSLWHERDMSHSSVERIIAPDATLALDFALHRLTSIIETLQVKEENMSRNIQLSRGTHASHLVLSALIKAGAGRNQAYDIVQQAAARVYAGDERFSAALAAGSTVFDWLKPEQLDALFDDRHYLRHVDDIFKRVFAAAEA